MNSVFKYCAPKPHYFKMLWNYQVNCSHPKYLNDKYENAAYLVEPYKLFCAAVQWDEKRKEQFDSHAIASFTNAEHANNEYFWNEYADNKKGFAIEFDKQILEERIASQYVIPCYLQDVVYDIRFNLDDFGNSFDADGQIYTVQDCIDSFRKGDYLPLDRLFRHLRLVKEQNRWKGEKESRIIIGNVRRSSHLHWNCFGCFLDLPSGAIKSIVIGDKMTFCHAILLRAIAKIRRIPILLCQ